MSFTNVSDIIKCFVNAHETVKALCFFNKVEDSILEMSFLVCLSMAHLIVLLRDSKFTLCLNN
jgi:hypothetical protein